MTKKLEPLTIEELRRALSVTGLGESEMVVSTTKGTLWEHLNDRYNKGFEAGQRHRRIPLLPLRLGDE